MAFAARYRSVCAACEGYIQPGDQIVSVPFTDDYTHVECPPEPPPAPVCPKCFLVLPVSGECDCGYEDLSPEWTI